MEKQYSGMVVLHERFSRCEYIKTVLRNRTKLRGHNCTSVQLFNPRSTEMYTKY